MDFDCVSGGHFSTTCIVASATARQARGVAGSGQVATGQAHTMPLQLNCH